MQNGQTATRVTVNPFGDVQGITLVNNNRFTLRNQLLDLLRGNEVLLRHDSNWGCGRDCEDVATKAAAPQCI